MSKNTFFDRALALKRANNDEALMQKVAIMMKKDLLVQIPLIEKAYQEQQWENLHALLHRLHGACCYTGATALERELRQTIDTIKANHTKSVSEGKATLIDCLRQTASNIEDA